MKILIKLLSGPNYITWKVQFKMALIKEGLWNIATGNAPENQGEQAKYMLRRDHAWAMIVLSGSNTVVLTWTRAWKSSCSLEKVGRSIPEEDMGKQIGCTKKVVQF